MIEWIKYWMLLFEAREVVRLGVELTPTSTIDI